MGQATDFDPMVEHTVCQGIGFDDEGIVAGSAKQDIPVFGSEEGIVAVAADQQIAGAVAGQYIVAQATGSEFSAGPGAFR